MRDDEMVFLGMQLPPPEAVTAVMIREKAKSEQKDYQLSNQDRYVTALQSISEQIIEVEGYD